MAQADVNEIADKAMLDVRRGRGERAARSPGRVKGAGRRHRAIRTTARTTGHLRYRLKDLEFEAIEKPVKAAAPNCRPARCWSRPQRSARVKEAVENSGSQRSPLAPRPTSEARGRPAAPRHVHHLGQHAGRRLGALRVRQVRGDLRPDLQGAHQARATCARAYDVILIPSQGRGGPRAWSSTSRRRAARRSPTRRRTVPSLGAYGESDDITGGMGLQGVAEMKFVTEGGLLITLGPEFLPGRVRPHPRVDARRPSGLLRARPDRRGRDPARASDLLRLHREDHPRPLRQRPATQRARDRQGQILMKFPGGDVGCSPA